MNSNKLHEANNGYKQNKYGIFGVVAITVVSILLIMAAIHLLTFPKQSADSGKGGEENSQSSEERKDNRADRSHKDAGKDKATPIPFNKATPGPGGSLKEFFDEKVRKKLPEFSIDLSQNQYKPGFTPPDDSNAFAVRSGQKPPHAPVLEIQGIMKTPLLKIVVMDSFSGNAWHMSAEPRYSEYRGGETQGLKSIKIKPVTAANGFIPIPSSAQSVKFPVEKVMNFPDYGMFYSDSELDDTYEVFCREVPLNEDIFKWAKVDMRIKYTRQVSPRVTELVDAIVKGIDDPGLKIRAIEAYLKRNYTYGGKSQNTQSQDAVQQFLFGPSRQGTELDFVSTFAFMLRTLDIPCRVVTGYRVEAYKSYQVVYADQIHVYPEVKFENYGWVPLDYFDDSTFYVPPVSTYTEVTHLDAVARKGKEFTVKGTVTDPGGKPVDGLPVLIYLKKTKEEDVLSYIQGSVSNGAFEITGQLHHGVDVGSYQVVAQTLENDTYRASWSDPEMKVVAETSLSAAIPGTVIAGKAFSVSGSVKESLSQKPLKAPWIDVSFDGIITEKESKEAAAKGEGTFHKMVKLEADKQAEPTVNYLFAGKYTGRFDISFRGNELYLPSSKSGEIQVWVIFWDRIFILLGLLFVASVAGLLARNRRRYAALGDRAGSHGEEESVAFYSETEESNTLKPKALEVTFPQIPSALPLVWGIHEPLTLRFTDESGEFEEVITSFEWTGTKNIVVYTNPGREAAGTASIRIVVYREEILRIGRELFTSLVRRYKLARRQLTPREVIEGLKERVPGELYQEFQELLYLFEMAAYSQREISRPEFERFYLLHSNIKNTTKEETE